MDPEPLRLSRAEDDALAPRGSRTPPAVGGRGLQVPPEAEKPGRLHPLRWQPPDVAAGHRRAQAHGGARTAATARFAGRPRGSVSPARTQRALAAGQPALALPAGEDLHLRREHPHRH